MKRNDSFPNVQDYLLNYIVRMYGIQQNQRNRISDYKEAIPNRKTTVKRGVFPFAIHANVVSKPRADTNQNASTSNSNNEGFYASNKRHIQHHIPTPFERPSTNVVNATFSNSSTTTEMNKNILLNQYLKQQYDSVVNEKNLDHKKSKYLDFGTNEAIQICTYKRIGEVINESLITKAVNDFQGSSLDMTSSIRQQLREIYLKRKTETNDVKEKKRKHDQVTTATQTSPVPETYKPVNSPATRDQNAQKIAKSYDRYYFRDRKPKTKNTSKFESNVKQKKLNKPVPLNDTLSSRKENDSIQFTKGNDNINCLSPRLHRLKGNNDWNSSTSSSFYCNRDLHDLKNSKERSYSPIDLYDFGTDIERKFDSKTCDFENTNNPVPRFSPEPRESRKRFEENHKPYEEAYREILAKLSRKSSPKRGKFFKNADPGLPPSPVNLCDGVMNSPSLFFCDNDDFPALSSIEKRVDEVPRNNFFAFDSVVAKRNLEPEDEKLLHPIKFLKSTVGCSQPYKRNDRKKKIKTPKPANFGWTPYEKKRYEEKPLKYNYYKSKNDIRRKTCLYSKILNR